MSSFAVWVIDQQSPWLAPSSTVAAYMLGLVTRGADFLANWGRIDTALAEALKAEARRRADTHAFFGFIGCAALVAG